MNIISFTTYNRLRFFKKTLETFFATTNKKGWRVIVADDGSTDGTIEWLREQKGIEIILNRRKGVSGQKNSILRHILNSEYNNLFLCDDDIIFSKKGWDKKYINSLKKIPHLSHYFINWRPQDNLNCPIIKDGLVCNCKPMAEQGAFLAFTKEAINKVGFVDVEKIGLSGMWHTDFSRRVYKGFNLNSDVIFDIKNSNEYIKLNMSDYCSAAETARYNVWDTPLKQLNRVEICKNNDVYIPFKELNINFNGTPKSILNKKFEKVYCINLERRPDRKAAMQLEADRINLDITFIEATDGNKLKPHPGLNKGQLGCIESHKKTWKQAIKDNVNTFLILEDDVLFHKDIQKFNFNNLPKWDVLYLGACQFSWGFDTSQGYYKNNIDTLATHAIGYTIKAATKLLEEAETTNFVLPIDNWMASVLPKKYNAFTIYPNLIIQKFDESDIKGASKEYKNKMRWCYSDYFMENNFAENVCKNTNKVVFLRNFQKWETGIEYELNEILILQFLKRNLIKLI